MISVAQPQAPRGTGLFDFPLQKRKQRRRAQTEDSERDRLSQREEAAQRGEEVSRGRAKAYLNDFLHRSEWGDRMNQFTVVWDAVPTMEELESYGSLCETEGTLACRKLFRAVVIWDALGHSLWERLRTTAEQKKAALKGLGPMLRMGVVRDMQEANTSNNDTDERSRRSRNSSSRSSSMSRIKTSSQQAKLRGKRSMAALLRNKDSSDGDLPTTSSNASTSSRTGSYDEFLRRTSGGSSGSTAYDAISEEGFLDAEGRPPVPKLIPQNLPVAVRKKLGVFSEGKVLENGGVRRSW